MIRELLLMHRATLEEEFRRFFQNYLLSYADSRASTYETATASANRGLDNLKALMWMIMSVKKNTLFRTQWRRYVEDPNSVETFHELFTIHPYLPITFLLCEKTGLLVLDPNEELFHEFSTSSNFLEDEEEVIISDSLNLFSDQEVKEMWDKYCKPYLPSTTKEVPPGQLHYVLSILFQKFNFPVISSSNISLRWKDLCAHLAAIAIADTLSNKNAIRSSYLAETESVHLRRLNIIDILDCLNSRLIFHVIYTYRCRSIYYILPKSGFSSDAIYRIKEQLGNPQYLSDALCEEGIQFQVVSSIVDLDSEKFENYREFRYVRLNAYTQVQRDPANVESNEAIDQIMNDPPANGDFDGAIDRRLDSNSSNVDYDEAIGQSMDGDADYVVASGVGDASQDDDMEVEDHHNSGSTGNTVEEAGWNENGETSQVTSISIETQQTTHCNKRRSRNSQEEFIGMPSSKRPKNSRITYEISTNNSSGTADSPNLSS